MKSRLAELYRVQYEPQHRPRAVVETSLRVEADLVLDQMVRQQRRGLTERWVHQLVRPFETWSRAELAISTDDHSRPMVAALGLLSPGEDPTFCNEAIDLGSMGMRSFITV